MNPYCGYYTKCKGCTKTECNDKKIIAPEPKKKSEKKKSWPEDG